MNPRRRLRVPLRRLPTRRTPDPRPFFLCLFIFPLFNATAEERPQEIRFASYNLENYLDPSALDRVKESVLHLLISEAKPDILGICEVGDEAALKHLQEALKKKGLDLPYSEWVDASSERHLALLSRFPIKSRQSIPYPVFQLDEMELPVSRGFLDVTLQLAEGYQLRCVGAHLKSRREVAVADQALIRRNEAHLLRLHAERILKESPHANLVLYGDFNDTRNSPSIRAIQGLAGSPQYLRALAITDSAGQSWTHYWDDADVYSRIDFLFLSRGLAREVEQAKSYILDHRDWALASDHRLMLMTLTPKNR